MKKYAVMKIYGGFTNPNVVYMTDNEQDARDMARIRKNDDNAKFVVVTVNVIAEEEPSDEQ
jgi:hypothetical protein